MTASTAASSRPTTRTSRRWRPCWLPAARHATRWPWPGPPMSTTSRTSSVSPARPAWSWPSAPAATALPGFGTVDGGIVLDLRDLDSIEHRRRRSRTAWAGGGVTAGAYTEAAAEHGLATGFGDTGSVGLGGLITGGGIGYLVRKHGLTIDSLLAAEVVTADGSVHLVDAEHEPDLFWAVRGGGGNVGVVTRFQLRLHDLPEVTGGMLILPATAETVAGFLEAAAAAPDELSTIANVMPCPPMPFVPEEHHGELVVFGHAVLRRTARRGPAGAGAVPRPGRADRRHARPDDLPDVLPAGRPRLPPDRRRQDDLPRRARPAVDRATRRAPGRRSTRRCGSPSCGCSVGPPPRVPNDATAYAHRDRGIMGVDRRVLRGRRRTVRSSRRGSTRRVRPAAGARPVRQLRQRRGRGRGPCRLSRRRPTTGSPRSRRRYDPTNLFRRNQNVPPAPAERPDDPARIHVHKI